MNRLIILGVVVVGALYVLFSSIYVVNEREQAIVMRFGQITDVQDRAGPLLQDPDRHRRHACRSSKTGCCATTSPT